MTFHESNFGSFAGNLQSDMDGYVHTSIKDVMAGNWDSAGDGMTRELASRIARENREEINSAERSIAEWQSA